MPKATGTVLVSPIPGEPLRYFIESWSDPATPHLVDLSYFQGCGRCSCKNWDTRKWPAIRDGKPLFTRATLCRHTAAAQAYWLQEELGKRARALNPQNENQV